MATRRPRRPPRSSRRPPAPAHAGDQDQAARIACLPEPYQSAARLLGDDWRFAELAWLYGLAHNGQDTVAADLQWRPLVRDSTMAYQAKQEERRG